EAIALPVEDLDLTAGAIEEHEQHRVEYLYLDVQLDQSGQAVDGFAEVDGFWVEIDLLHLGVGTHHGMNSGENGSSASNDQQAMGRWGLWSGYPIAGSPRALFVALFGIGSTVVRVRHCLLTSMSSGSTK